LGKLFQSSPDWNGSLQSLQLNLKEVVTVTD
jgi:hypothetical protein